jgi:hypothetical protein
MAIADSCKRKEFRSQTQQWPLQVKGRTLGIALSNGNCRLRKKEGIWE